MLGISVPPSTAFSGYTRHSFRRLSVLTELLVLTDFGVCPLVELRGFGEWLAPR